LASRRPEQELIDIFLEALYEHDDERLMIETLHNKNCKSKKYADIEFTSKIGELWVVEVKSNVSKDAHNTVHKIFGELLKETGRKNRGKCKFAILIPEEAKIFYSRLFQSIKRDKFVGFGELIPVQSAHGKSGIGIMSWKEIYDFH
jgi:hypothetical protein